MLCLQGQCVINMCHYIMRTMCLLLVYHLHLGSGSEVNVWLEMPRYAPRGSSVSLVCRHNVAQELLYRVEWRRGGGRLFQYIKNRSPSPYRVSPTPGAHINMSLSNERKIVLDNVQFSASGSYSCEISLETPIFTKSSAVKELIVIQPQRHLPHITFNSEVYTINDILEATCTTSQAFPAPHITWLINGVKVDIVYVSSLLISRRPIYLRTSSSTTTQSITMADSSFTTIPTTTTTRICSSSQVNKSYNALQRRRFKKPSEMDEKLVSTKPVIQRHNRPEALQTSSTRLRVPVAKLNLENDSRLQLTCLSTIPAYRGPLGHYADSKNRTVIVDVTFAEEQELSMTTTETYQNGCIHHKSQFLNYLIVFWCQIYLLVKFMI